MLMSTSGLHAKGNSPNCLQGFKTISSIIIPLRFPGPTRSMPSINNWFIPLGRRPNSHCQVCVYGMYHVYLSMASREPQLWCIKKSNIICSPVHAFSDRLPYSFKHHHKVPLVGAHLQYISATMPKGSNISVMNICEMCICQCLLHREYYVCLSSVYIPKGLKNYYLGC